MITIQFPMEQSQAVRDFLNKRDFDFHIRIKANMTTNGYLFTILEGEENIDKLKALLKDNIIEFD